MTRETDREHWRRLVDETVARNRARPRARLLTPHGRIALAVAGVVWLGAFVWVVAR